MATYTKYDMVGIKEDISDVISNISPTKTPFQALIGSDKAKQTTFQWQEDSLRSATQANARVEGADATFVDRVPTVMRSNVTQILSEAVVISETADVVSTYGRAKETAYELAKASKALKRDLEVILVGASQAAVVGTSSTARKMANAIPQIAAATTTAGGTAALTETMVLTAAQTVYDAGGEATVLMIKPTDANRVAAFASATGRYRDIGGGKTVTMSVEVLVTPFGTLKVVLNRFQATTHAFLLDPDMWKLVTLRPWSRETLAKTGDATKMQILGEFSLKHMNQSGSGMINALT